MLSIKESEPTPANTIFFATWRGTYLLVASKVQLVQLSLFPYLNCKTSAASNQDFGCIQPAKKRLGTYRQQNF